jgi:ribosomal protein L16 Arg81 hydroxylase
MDVPFHANRVNRMSLCLDDLIHPVAASEFLAHWWGKAFTHVTGYRGKFTNMFSWQQLNEILEQHILKPPRLLLIQKGQQIQPNKYLEYDADWQEPRLRTADFLQQLAGGATLVLNHLEDLYEPIGQLAASLERRLRAHVRVNLYAGWRKDNGFNLHWDPQDTLILQVAGRKHWKVYGPTRLHPFKGDIGEAPQPTSAPVWDEILEDGALLYIPRGWWHVAFPLDEPTLHLTVTIPKSTWIHLLHWYVDQLKTHDECREDLPVLNSTEEQQNRMEAIRQHLLNGWNFDLLDRFLRESDEKAQPRPVIQLPEMAAPESPKIDMISVVTPRIPRTLHLTRHSEDRSVSFECNGRRWEFSEVLIPALEALSGGREWSFFQLIDRVNEPDAADVVRQMVISLWKAGLVTVSHASKQAELGAH